MRNAILLSAGLMCASQMASAADNGIYFGAALGRANVEVDQNLTLNQLALDGDDAGFKFIAGIRPLDWLAAEISYVDFGSVRSGAQTVESDGVSGYVIGFMPIGPVDVFAKGGLINFDSSVRRDNLGEIFADDGNEFAYGVGVQFRLLSLSVRAEYEAFDVDNVDLNMLSLGLTYTFL